MNTAPVYPRLIPPRMAEALTDTPVVLMTGQMCNYAKLGAQVGLDGKTAAKYMADYRLLYYRDADKFEVDVVIENAATQVIGVEVKASATVKESDFRGLKKLADVAGAQFKMGVVLYDGIETMPMGKGLWAAPLSSLWGI